ncbi:MAG: HIATL1 protein [Marteilia pararefringens]
MEQEKANLDTLDATNAKKDQIDERSYANNCTLKVKNQELNTFFIIFATEFLFALFIDTNIDLIKIEFGDNYMLAFTIIISIKGLMSLSSAILCGNLSDKFGRKPLIMFTMFMSFLPHLLILKSCYLAYFICLTLGGIFNDHMNLLVTFGADISSKRNRDKTFSILISASFFANAFASIIGEYLISVKDNGTLDFRYVVATSFIILVFVQIYTFFTLDSSKSGGQSIPNKNYRIDGSNNEPEVEGNGIVGKISRYMHQENVKKVVILVSISTFVIEGLLFTNLLYLRYIVTFSERDLAKYMLFSLLTYGIHSFICPRILIDKLGYRNAIMLCIIFQIISTNVNGIFSNEM